MADNNSTGPNPSANSPGPATTNGRAGGNGSTPPPPTVEPTVAVRRERYMVAARPLPGVQPMAVDVIAGALTNMPDVTVVKRVRPRGFGALSAGGGGSGGTPEIVVAEMPPERGLALQASAQQGVIVERDALLRHADDLSTSFTNAATMLPGVGVDVRLRIVGMGGQPLPKATVFVYGLGFPAQGLTGDNGEVTVTLFGSTLDTIQAIYVKPAADHWDRMIDHPVLSDGVNTLQLRPLSDTFRGFPQAATTGWGQRIMKLDQQDPSLAGQGVKIGIIDSGCDNTHPQLTHVTRGMDFTNNRDAASWTRDTMSHGTHCAGIITGASNQLKGVRGFAPMAEVHALKVFPGGRFSDLIDALDQCIDRQIDIVNLSLGSSETSELVAHKLVEVRQHGVACIVAAGNASGPVQFPGSEPSVLTVSAIGKLEEFPADSYHAQTVVPNLVAGSMFSPKFTCFGPQVAVAGPGVAIVSTVPGGGYASWDGTSMATPHITGMGALLLAHHPTFRDGNRVRNEQRVAQLFSLLASAGVRMLGDPTREGAGVPDLQRVAGLGTAPRPSDTVQTASAPIGGILGNSAGQIGNFMPASVPFPTPPFQGGQLGQFAPASVPFPSPAFQGGQLGQFSPLVANPFAPNVGINPAVLQSLLQLRSAGLL
jgi:subtilisin